MTNRPTVPHEYQALIDVEGLSVRLDVVIPRNAWLPAPLEFSSVVGAAASLAAQAVSAGITEQQQREPAPF